MRNILADGIATLAWWAIFTLAFSGCVSTPPTPSPEPVALPWKNSKLDAILHAAIDANWADLSKAKDFDRACPKFGALDEKGKKAAVAALLVGMAKFESSYKQTTTYTETTMGIDPVTGKQVVSEGHFQLSYQDEEWAKCGISYSKRNIQDPAVNIPCAVKIMAGHAKKHGEVFLFSPYWSVIRDGDSFEPWPSSSDSSRYCARQKGVCRYTKYPLVVAEVKKSAPFCN